MAAAMGIPSNPNQPPPQPPANNASLYIGDLEEDVNEAMVFEKFTQIGQILSIRVCRDMISKRSLGYAYLNFANSQDAEKAIENLNFDTLRGRQMRIMWSQRDPSLRRSGVGNLFIKNLEKTVTTRELYDTFSLFGEILSCKIATDDKGASKGYGFIHFSTKEAADKAIERLNEKIIKQKKIFVAPFVPRQMRESGVVEPTYNNIFIKNFSEDMTTEKLTTLFAPFGEITSIKVEEVDGKNRGFGFVCYKEPSSAVEAVKEMNGHDIDGKQIFVGRAMKKSERAEFLRQQFEKKKQDKTEKFAMGVNLYVKNLDDTMDDETLRNEFSVNGKVTSVRVMRDPSGRSKGFGFVCFSNAEEATKAVTDMNGKLMSGKPLYVALAQRKEERRQLLASQYMQRQMAMRPQMTMPQPNMINPQQQALNMLMNFQTQNPAAFYPNMRGMVPPPMNPQQAAAAAAAAQMQQQHPHQQQAPHHNMMGYSAAAGGPRPANRWNAPQPGGAAHMRGGAPAMMQGYGAAGAPNRMMRPPQMMAPQMNMAPRGAPPAPQQPQGVRPGEAGTVAAQQGGAQMRPQAAPGNVQYTSTARNIGQNAAAVAQQQQVRAAVAAGMMPQQQAVPQSAPTHDMGGMPADVDEQGGVGAGGDKPSFLGTLHSASAEDQKQLLGERIYEIILPLYPDLAGKLTGMLLELDNRELMSMYMEASSIQDFTNSQSALRTRVDAAYEVLRKNTATATTNGQKAAESSE